MTQAEKREYNKAYYARTRERQITKAKEWQQANRDHCNAKNRAWHSRHLGRYRTKRKEWSEQNKDRRKVTNKTWRQNNYEQCQAVSQAYYQANREKVLARHRAWRKTNRLKTAAYTRKHNSKLLQTAEGKLVFRLRVRVGEALKAQKAWKSKRTIPLLGCDIQWLVAWLEIHFRTGMTWENYGPIWHVDHIRPCASFDLSDPRQQKLCFHWTNLQPLFAEENWEKHAKWQEAVA